MLSEPKTSKIVKPNIKVVDVRLGSVAGGTGSRGFTISLTSETVAPFVWLDLKLKSGISGQFMENGFFIFDGKKSIVFETNSNVTETQIIDNLLIKSVTDVIA